MSKKQYTDTFSNIHPSDETIERIMSMTNKKHFTGFSKTLVALVAVISILCSIGLVANAATDGAVAETVSEVFEAVSNKVTILINGKETEAEIDVSEKTNSDGEKYYEAEIKVDIPDAYVEAKCELQLDGDTVMEDIDSALRESIELHIYKEETE